MAITREELTDEQYKQLEKLYKRYVLKLLGIAFLYLGFSFFANLLIVILDKLYVQSPQFVFFGVLGTGVITISGIRGTVSEQRDILLAKVKEIVGHL